MGKVCCIIFVGVYNKATNHYADGVLSAESIAAIGEFHAKTIFFFIFTSFRMSVKTQHDLPNDLYCCRFTSTNYPCLKLHSLTLKFLNGCNHP